jgi:hypothetical protein
MEMAVRSIEMAEIAMETDGYGSGGTSPSRQGARIGTSVPQNLSAVVAELRTLSRKLPIPLGFSVLRLLIGEGVSSGVAPGLLTPRWHRPGVGHVSLV